MRTYGAQRCGGVGVQIPLGHVNPNQRVFTFVLLASWMVMPIGPEMIVNPVARSWSAICSGLSAGTPSWAAA